MNGFHCYDLPADDALYEELLASMQLEDAGKGRQGAVLTRVDDARSNIAAGVAYDRQLWVRWERDSVHDDRWPFTMASVMPWTAMAPQGMRRPGSSRPS